MSNPQPDDTGHHLPPTRDQNSARGGGKLDDEFLPRELGDFRLIREIGRGGMGTVFEAEQVSLCRRVAVKLLRIGLGANPDAVDRFRREAETVARLHHTNIVPIYFVGTECGTDFYAMEFIDGPSLAQVLADEAGPLETEGVLQWGLQAAEALAHAHQRGVIHRDVKPSNLLLDRDGRIWLTDFGLAKRLDDMTQSMTGTVLGTPRYMSPEQASAARHELDHRTDIYSLGATLYELLTGCPVFSAETPHQVVMKILHDEPIPPRQVAPSLSRDIQTVLMKCLQKDPDQRYQSAQDLADDLRAVLEHRPIKARRAGLGERAVRWFKRHRRSVRLVGASAAATLSAVILVLLALFWVRQRQLAYVTLATNRPPLVAEIRNASNAIVARQTVPTEQPLEIPAGPHTMQVTGDLRLSETYQVRLERGEYPKFDLDLNDSLLMAPLDVAKTYRIVELENGSLVLVLDNEGLRCWDIRRAELRWTKSLLAGEDPSIGAVPGWIWPWNRLCSGFYSGWGAFDMRPFVADPGCDLNGDDVADILLATRHQACLLAISGADGRTLWTAPMGQDLRESVGNQQSRLVRGVVSGIIAAPEQVGDQDGDGVVDFLVVVVEEPDNAKDADRRLEVVSGRSGETLWRRELDDKWFMSPPDMNVPESFRWFRGSGVASSRSGGGQDSIGGEVVRRNRGGMERTGYFHHAPSGVMMLSWHPGRTEPLRATVLAGSHLLAFNTNTGEPVGEPLDCTMQPGKLPIAADLDGDGAEELVLIQELPAASGAPAGSAQVRVAVVSLAQRRVLWSRNVVAEWPQTQQALLAPPAWPVATDLDGDGKFELIVPNGSSQAVFNMSEAWGELEVLDALTGKTRWKRRLKTMDQQVDHFLPGPDVDGDGIREVYTATLWSPNLDLYVDVLSGRDGKCLSVGRHTLRRINESVWYHLGPPLWWNAGTDGWPQLVVPVQPGEGSQAKAQVCVFSSGTAKLTRLGIDLGELQTIDGDGDGIEDLFAFGNHSEESLDQGGSLVLFRGQDRQLWQGLGDPWVATVDLDEDGARDLVRPMADGTLRAASSRNGAPLWRTQPLFFEPITPKITAALPHQDGAAATGHLADEITACEEGHNSRAGDWDGDGVVDLLAYASNVTHYRPYSPLHALSGRTGKRLWSAEIELRSLDTVLALDCRDLDGDGLSEVIWVAPSDWGFEESRTVSAHRKQVTLAVLSGRDGRLVWKEPLTTDYGFSSAAGSAPYQFDQGWLPVTVGDLDSDGVSELIVPAEVGGDDAQPLQELRVLNGKTGKVVWRLALPPPRDVRHAFNDLPPPLLCDLDGDGRAEVLLLTFEKQADGPGSVAVLRALKSSDGNELWSCRFDVPDSCGMLSGQADRFLLRPRPVVLQTAAGPPLICLNLWDGPERVVVVDATGQTVSDFRLETQRGYHRGHFRVWACDTNGDGNDEILLSNRDHLMAISPSQPDHPLWQHPVEHLWSDQIEGVLPYGTSNTPSVVVRRVNAPSSIYALNAADGKRVWSVAVPLPRHEGHYVLVDRGQDALLNRGTRSQPPWVFLRHGFLSQVRVASMAGADDDRIAAIGAKSVRAVAVPALLGDFACDARRLRPLPWNVSDTGRSRLPILFCWVVFYSATLVYIPSVYAIDLVRRRRFSLGRFLLLPVVAALALVGVVTDAPDLIPGESMTKFLIAVFALPVLIAIVRLVQWGFQRRWPLVAGWLAATIVTSVPLAVFALIRSQSIPQFALQPDEHYSWSGWYLIWIHGAYAVACILTISLLALATWHALRSRLHRKRPACG